LLDDMPRIALSFAGISLVDVSSIDI